MALPGIWTQLSGFVYRQEEKQPFSLLSLIDFGFDFEPDEVHYEIAAMGPGSCRGRGGTWNPPFCSVCFRTTPVYLMVLSLFAVVVIISDNVEMFTRNCLPACDWRCLVPDTNGCLLRTTRQLMGGLALLMYVHLFFGVYLRNPTLLVPYLVVQVVNILLSCTVLILALVTKRCALNKSMFFQYTFMVVNWLECYCHYLSMFPRCGKSR